MTARTTPTLLAVSLVASALGVGAAGLDLFDDIYARGRSIETTLKTLTARFAETSHSPLLARPLVARGTIAVVRPMRIAMHYTVPDARTVIIDNGTLRVVWPAQAIDRTTSIGAMATRIQRYFVDTSPQQLRSHFDVAARIASDRPDAWFVTMTPKRKQIRDGLSQLELWIRHDSVMLSAMRMIFPSGDSKLLEFEDVQINPTIDESAFAPRKN